MKGSYKTIVKLAQLSECMTNLSLHTMRFSFLTFLFSHLCLGLKESKYYCLILLNIFISFFLFTLLNEKRICTCSCIAPYIYICIYMFYDKFSAVSEVAVDHLSKFMDTLHGCVQTDNMWVYVGRSGDFIAKKKNLAAP